MIPMDPKSSCLLAYLVLIRMCTYYLGRYMPCTYMQGILEEKEIQAPGFVGYLSDPVAYGN